MAKELEELSLRDIIPPSISGDKNIQSIISASDPQLQEVSRKIREAFIISRINELPENVIDLLAWQWHVDFYEPDLPLATKRELVLESIKWHRKKGTKAAIISALEKLGFVPTIKEWFEPELRTAPHTFSITGYYRDDHMDVEFLGEDTHGILTRVIEATKPARSSLLKLTIAPIPMDMTKHICRWDHCNWEHAELKSLYWGTLTPNDPISDEPQVAHGFERGVFTVSDVSFWDTSVWEERPYRWLQFGSSFELGIFASLEWGEGDFAMLSPNLWDYSRWDYVSMQSNVIGFEFEHSIYADTEIEQPQIICAFTYTDIICDLRPRWDERNWTQHYTWAESIRQETFAHGFIRGITASLEWNDKRDYPVSFWDNNRWDCVEYPPEYDAPLPKWSSYKTWEKSNTWNITAELSVGLQIDFQED